MAGEGYLGTAVNQGTSIMYHVRYIKFQDPKGPAEGTWEAKDNIFVTMMLELKVT